MVVINAAVDDGRRCQLGGRPDMAPLYSPIEVSLINARDSPHPGPELHTCGFELVRSDDVACTCPADALLNEHNASPTARWSDLHGAYYTALESLIQKRTGAARVKAFHHKIRDSRSAADETVGRGEDKKQGGKTGAPASVAHCDYDAHRALELFLSLHESHERKGRFAIINAWRSLGEKPIEDHHLAMCDTRTVAAPDDFVPVDMVEEGGDGTARGAYLLNCAGRARFQWSYFPGMEPSEILLFMQYDSDPTAGARFCFHSAVRDPSVVDRGRATTAALAPRTSIEVRLIAFWPGAEPNTIPDALGTEDSRIEHCFQRIFNSVNYPEHWGQQGKSWIRAALSRPDPGAAILQDMVSHGRAKKENGLDLLDGPQVDRLLARLLSRAGEFEAAAKKNFGALDPEERVAHSVNAVIEALRHPQLWPPAAKAWMKNELSRPHAASRIAPIMVREGRKKGEYGMDILSQDQVNQVEQRLLLRAAEFEAIAKKNFF